MRKKTKNVDRCDETRIAIRPAYIPKLKQIAALTGASVEAAVNQAVSDMLESA